MIRIARLFKDPSRFCLSVMKGSAVAFNPNCTSDPLGDFCSSPLLAPIG